ncbi:MAG: T9SS type A sorting domain-containing protein [bacterium]|nr:T9SS type A sorting domain-containing protein [bacterium]
MKSLITLFALLSLSLSATAQPPDTLWTRTFGGSDADIGYSVQQSSDGGYVIVGYMDYNGAVYLIKTDAAGNEVWQRIFGEDDYAVGYSVQQTSEGGYIIAGTTSDISPSTPDVYLIKTDATGNLIWQRTFGGSGSDWGLSVQQTTDGGYIIVGGTRSYGAGYDDVYLIKTDANGNSVWTRTFGGSDNDCGYSVQQTSDGGYVIAGGTYSYGTGSYDVYLIKTDANGDSVWTRTFGGSNYDFGSSVQQTADGGYIIGGGTVSFGAGNSDVYLIKTDAEGNLNWQHTFGGYDDDYCYRAQQTSDGGYIIAGRTDSYGAGGFDVYLIKTDAGGTPVKPWIEPTSLPTKFTLLGAFPNPFNPSTTIRFNLPQTARVALEVFDVNGRVVGVHHVEPLQAGEQSMTFDGSALPSGVYLYRLTAGELAASGKMVLMK